MEQQITELNQEGPEEKLRRLKDKRVELESLLKAIEATLIEEGYLDERTTHQRHKSPLTGIRIGNKLSFRGEEKAGEFFDYLDEDGDGLLTLQNIRAMQSYVSPGGVVSDPQYSNVEVWKLCCYDMGIHINSKNCMDKANFIKFRKQIEPHQPLTRELEIHGLSFLTKTLQLWSDVKTLVRELYAYRKLIKRNNKSQAGDDEDKVDERLGLEDVVFILSNVDIVYHKSEFARIMIDRIPLERIMEQLLRSNVRKRFASSPSRVRHLIFDELSGSRTAMNAHMNRPIVVEDIKFITPIQLIPWLFGNRPPPRLPKGYYRSAMKFKYTSIRQIRYWDTWFKSVYDVGIHFRNRMIYRDFKVLKKLPPNEQQTQLFSCQGKLGSVNNNSTDDGMSISWKLSRMESPESYFVKLDLPRECGTVFMVEFLVKSSATEADIKSCVDHLKMFLRFHMDEELKNNLQYRTIYVLSGVSPADGGRVIRVSLTYKRLVSIDGFMKLLFIPYEFMDLVTDFTGEVKTTTTLYEILTSGHGSIDHMLTCYWDIRMLYRRDLILSLLKRTILACACGDAKRHVDKTDDVVQLQEQRQFRYIKQYFPHIVKACESIKAAMEGLDVFNGKMFFKSTSESLFRLSFLSRWFRMNVPPQFGSQPGYAKHLLEKYSKSFFAEVTKHYERLKKHLEDGIKAEEEARRRMLLEHIEGTLGGPGTPGSATDRAAEATGRLKSLGLGADTDFDSLIERRPETPKSLVDDERERDTNSDIQTLSMLESFSRTCMDVHVVELICGNTKLSVSLQGVDIFEFIPTLPSIIDVTKAVNERRKILQEKNGKKSRQRMPV